MCLFFDFCRVSRPCFAICSGGLCRSVAGGGKRSGKFNQGSYGARSMEAELPGEPELKFRDDPSEVVEGWTP